MLIQHLPCGFMGNETFFIHNAFKVLSGDKYNLFQCVTRVCIGGMQPPSASASSARVCKLAT